MKDLAELALSAGVVQQVLIVAAAALAVAAMALYIVALAMKKERK